VLPLQVVQCNEMGVPLKCGAMARMAHAMGYMALLLAPCVARGQTEPTGAARENTAEPSNAGATASEAPPTKQECIQAHVQTQVSQRDNHLTVAREQARVCASQTCPGMVVSDCGRWLNSLDQRIPSVVFEVRVNGEPGPDVLVFVDNQPVVGWTDGEALPLDPGEHEFRFESPPFEPIVQTVLLAEGARYRVVEAHFTSAPPPVDPAPVAAVAPMSAPSHAPPPPALERPVPVSVYPLLGVAGLGAAGFAVFGLIANAKLSDLEERCQPNCTDAEVQPLKTSRVVADVSLGVGVASLVAAGVVYLVRPERPGAPAVGLAPLPGGAGSYVSGSF